MSCDRFKVGDEGQRYRVVGIDRDTGEEFVFGWTDREDGGGLAEMAKRHPQYGTYKVIDRRNEELEVAKKWYQEHAKEWPGFFHPWCILDAFARDTIKAMLSARRAIRWTIAMSRTVPQTQITDKDIDDYIATVEKIKP